MAKAPNSKRKLEDDECLEFVTDVAFFKKEVEVCMSKSFLGALVKERKYYFLYKTDGEMQKRYEEWESLFANLLVQKPQILKTVIWEVMTKLYINNEWALNNVKNDGYACKQLLISLLVKGRVVTSGARQPEVLQRLLKLLPDKKAKEANKAKEPGPKADQKATAARATAPAATGLPTLNPCNMSCFLAQAA